MKKIFGIIIFTIVVVVLIVLLARNFIFNEEEQLMEINLTVTSTAFKEGESIPMKYTGYSDELSPPLTLSEMDSNSKSIAIIMEDLDTPIGVISHWVLWNIPAQTHEIPEGIQRGEKVEQLGFAQQGRNMMFRLGYMGPKPPWGIHRYIFRVYVLDTMLDIKAGSNRKQLTKAMVNHILQYGTLMGTYQK